jgi:hypothetical protein
MPRSAAAVSRARDSSSLMGGMARDMQPSPIAETKASPILRWGNLDVILGDDLNGLMCRTQTSFENGKNE